MRVKCLAQEHNALTPARVRTNLVPRASHPPAPGGGRMRDPGNEVGLEPGPLDPETSALTMRRPRLPRKINLITN